MTDKTPKARSNATHAVEQLREQIFSGKLGAGTDHLESELAENLGMSRTPVREALLVLEGQGLVDVRPRKGVRIRPLSPTDMAEVYEVLTSLEGLAASKVASAGFTEKDLSGLSSAIDQMDDALEKADLPAWAEADDAFHTELVRLSGNSRLQATVALMSDQVKRARLITLHMRTSPTQSNNDHRELFKHICRGDAKAAEQLHRNHCDRARNLMVELLQKYNLNSI